MKRLLLSIALMTCLPVFAQDQPKNSDFYFNVYRIESGYRINAFTADGDQLVVTSANLEWVDRSVSCLLRLSGNVEIRTKGVVLQADEADYHCSSISGAEIEPRGNVHFKPFQQQ